MERARVLFADDHIPDDDLADEQVEPHYRAFVEQAFSNRPASFREEALKGFIVMHKAVKALRSDGFRVTIANTYKRAMELATSEQFDIAIVDLGWMMDLAVPPGKQSDAGWEICDAIDAGDKRRRHTTLQIINSSRLISDSRIINRAALQQKLPVLKQISDDRAPSDVAIDGLWGAVRFLEQELGSDRRSARAWFRAVEKQNLEQLSWWASVAGALVVVAVLAVVAGVALAFTGRLDIAVVTTASGALVSVIGALIFGRLNAAQSTVDKTSKRLAKELDE